MATATRSLHAELGWGPGEDGYKVWSKEKAAYGRPFLVSKNLQRKIVNLALTWEENGPLER